MSSVDVRPVHKVADRADYLECGVGELKRGHKAAGTDRLAVMFCSTGSIKEFVERGEALAEKHGRTVQAHGYLQNFEQHEFDVNDPEDLQRVNDLGYMLAQRMHPNSDVLVVTHNDSDGGHAHNHILVLNHDNETGLALKKYRTHASVKKVNDELMREQGLRTVEDRQREIVLGLAPGEASRERVEEQTKELVGAAGLQQRLHASIRTTQATYWATKRGQLLDGEKSFDVRIGDAVTATMLDPDIRNDDDLAEALSKIQVEGAPDANHDGITMIVDPKHGGTKFRMWNESTGRYNYRSASKLSPEFTTEGREQFFAEKTVELEKQAEKQREAEIDSYIAVSTTIEEFERWWTDNGEAVPEYDLDEVAQRIEERCARLRATLVLDNDGVPVNLRGEFNENDWEDAYELWRRDRTPQREAALAELKVDLPNRLRAARDLALAGATAETSEFDILDLYRTALKRDGIRLVEDRKTRLSPTDEIWYQVTYDINRETAWIGPDELGDEFTYDQVLTTFEAECEEKRWAKELEEMERQRQWREFRAEVAADPDRDLAAKIYSQLGGPLDEFDWAVLDRAAEDAGVDRADWDRAALSFDALTERGWKPSRLRKLSAKTPKAAEKLDQLVEFEENHSSVINAGGRVPVSEVPDGMTRKWLAIPAIQENLDPAVLEWLLAYEPTEPPALPEQSLPSPPASPQPADPSAPAAESAEFRSDFRNLTGKTPEAQQTIEGCAALDEKSVEILAQGKRLDEQEIKQLGIGQKFLDKHGHRFNPALREQLEMRAAKFAARRAEFEQTGKPLLEKWGQLKEQGEKRFDMSWQFGREAMEVRDDLEASNRKVKRLTDEINAGVYEDISKERKPMPWTKYDVAEHDAAIEHDDQPGMG